MGRQANAIGRKSKNMNGKRYRSLSAYQAAKTLVKEVYALLKKFPKEEQYALCDQLRRAVISVPSNIAEGMGRTTDKDQAHFLEIAYGSLMETQCQLEIAFELGYITKEEFDNQDNAIEAIGKMLSSLRMICKPSPIAFCPSPNSTPSPNSL